jgi:hypothetical protein
MPPRRPPRRGKSHGLPGTPALDDIALKDLRRAHSLMERGEHANAAVLFERQARDAGDRGLYLPAAHLCLQAGRARFLAGETEAGEARIHQGMDILAKNSNPLRLAKSGGLLMQDLSRLGQETLAEDVKQYLEQELKNHPESVAVPEALSPGLPFKCLKCNAILRPEDLEPIGNRDQVCVYCGSLPV